MAILGSLIEQVRGVSYKPEDLYTTLNKNSITLLRANNIKDGQLNFDDVVYVDRKKVADKQLLKAGDILICASSGSKELVGKAAYVASDLQMTFGAFCKVVRPRIECSRYIGHFFNSPYYRERITNSAAGANINNIRNEHIDVLEIAWPSVEEQRSAVTVLDKVIELIALRKEQLAALDQLVKSRFIELFGDPETNPKGLEKALLSDIAEYFNGLTYSPDNVTNDGTIVLRSSNIQNSQLDFADTVRVNSSIKGKLFVKDNDILMCSRNGSARLVGKVALIKNLSEPMTFGAFMMIIRSKYYPYLMTYFQMDAFRRQISTGATTTINQITGNMLNKISLPLPKMADINEFATFVEQTDKSKLAIQRSLDELETLKKALMQKYFG